MRECLLMHWSCIGHASHMHTRCTFATHTLTLDMFCIHLCQLSLFRLFSICNMFLCLCHALVYTLFHHPQYVMFTLCFVAFFRCFCLSFGLHFLIHLASFMHHLLPLFISSSSFFSFLLIHLSIHDKKGESILQSIPECFVISI